MNYELKIKNIFLIFILLLSIDQLSKYLIRSHGGFYICNKNIAFGINIPEITFWIFWLIIIFFILFFLYKKYFIHNTLPTGRQALYIILILSGAISNIIDRFYFGCVIDFIDLRIWPVFNLADTFIVLGAIMIIIKHTTYNAKHK